MLDEADTNDYDYDCGDEENYFLSILLHDVSCMMLDLIQRGVAQYPIAKDSHFFLPFHTAILVTTVKNAFLTEVRLLRVKH